MARYGQRPENALKRANEFLEVGKSPRALETLYEVFRNKKWAYNCSESILEPIMFKYLDLCVELRKSHIAKEGLFQYRNMFQTVNVGSLENVIRGYLRSAEEKTELAREHSHQAVIDIDDLDNLPTPESILLRAVSGEGAQDRSDRTILTPWVKFLWESYCQCLELLRTNALVETLYHDIARMAYQFCLKYNRKTEFRKLCDKLRKHLEDIGKLAPQANNVSLTRPETQQYNLETRLIQLDYAIQMELWQEAYKATEDIHNLMTMSKKSPAPKTMANYYQKLALVFWKAGPAYYLYHAAALFKLFQLNKEMKKNITQEDLQRMASRVLLATLAIPLPSAHPEFDRFIETDKSPLEKAQKLAVLLTLNQPPTRSSLLKDLARYNVLNMASPPLQELYNLLEVNFNPLQLCSKVENIIEVLQDSDQYIPPLKDVTLVILIRQVSQVYETITYSRLLQLAHFATQFHMERLLMECVRQNDMQIRIDHGKGCIYFGADLSESQREDKLEGVIIQSMPSEQIRNQLVNMNDVLHRCLQIINPNYTKGDSEQIHRAMVQRYHEIKHHEHQRILARHKIIEKRKEYLEQMNTVREQEEAKKTEEIARQQAMAEQKRLEIEREERERKRQENELQQIKDRTLKEKMHQISLTAHGQKLLKTLQGDELKNLDADKIAVREAEELQKERKEQQQKLKLQEKKLDHFERAKRLEEIPLLKLAWKEKEEADRKFWHQQGLDKIQTMKQERKLALQHRDRLKRMEVDENAYLKELKNQRFSSYKEKIEQFEKELKEIRKERLENRKRERIEKRKADYRKKLEEEAERKRQEEKREQEEEERKKREEEKAKERKIREELDRQSEQARKREEEAAKKYEAGGASGMGSRAPAASSDKAFWRGGRSADTKNDDKPMERKPRDSLRKPEEEGAKKPAKAAGGWRDKAKDEPAESSRSEGSRWKMDESRRRDDDEGIRRRDGDGNRRREDEGYRRRDDDGFRRKDDDGFRRKDDDSFRRKDDDGFRRKDEDGFRRKDDDSFRRKDDDSFRRKDDDSFRRKDDDSFRRKDDDSFRRKDDDGFRRKDDDGMRRKDDGNIRRRDDDSFTFRRREDDRKPDQETSWRSRNAPSERKTFSRDTDRDDRGPDNRERRFNSDKPARLESDDKDRGRSAFGSDRKSDGKGWRGAPSFPSRKPDDSKSWRQDHE